MAAVVESYSEESGSGFTRTLSVPDGTTDGDLLVAFFTTAGYGVTVATPAGWTRQTYLSGNVNLYLFSKIASSESGTYSFTQSKDQPAAMVVLRVSGADQTSPVNVVANYDPSGIGQTSVVVPSITTTVDGCLLLSMASTTDSDGSFTQPTGMAMEWTGTAGSGASGSSVKAAVASEALAAAGATGTRTWTGSSTYRWSFATLAVAPASGPSEITGSFTSAEGADSAAFTGDVLVFGSLAGTEGADAASLAGVLVYPAISGDLWGIDGPDGASVTGVVLVSGALAGAEGADALAVSGIVPATGAFAITEGADSAAFSGFAVTAGEMAAIEGADNFSASGIVPVLGALASIDGADAATMTGSAPATGALEATEGADSSEMSGFVFDDIAGALEATEGADTCVLAGRVRNRSEWVLQWA